MKATFLVVGLCLLFAHVEAKTGRSVARDSDWDATNIFLDAAEGLTDEAQTADCKEYIKWEHFGSFAVEYDVTIDPSIDGFTISVAMRAGVALNEGDIRGVGFNLPGITCADIAISGIEGVTLDVCNQDSSSCGDNCNFVSATQNVFDVAFSVNSAIAGDDVTSFTIDVTSTASILSFGNFAVRAIKVGLSISDRSGTSKDMGTELIPCTYDNGLRLSGAVWGDPHYGIFGTRLSNQKITPTEDFRIAGYWQLLDVVDKSLQFEIRTALCRVGRTCVREVAITLGTDVVTYSEARGFRLNNVGVRFHDLQAGQLTEDINVEYIACDTHRPLGIFVVRFEGLRAQAVIRTGHRAQDGLKIDIEIPDQWTDGSGIRGQLGSGEFDHEWIDSSGVDLGTILNIETLTTDFFMSYAVSEANSVIVQTKQIV